MKSQHIIFAILISLTLILAGGCATGKKKPTKLDTDELANVKKAGFFDDYSNLQPGRSPWDSMYVWQNPNAFFQQYNKVIIETAEYWGKSGVSPQSFKDDKRLTDKVHDAMVKSFSRRYEVVKEPGFDVMKIRFAIVDEDANPPVQKYKSSSTTMAGAPPTGTPQLAKYITTMYVITDSQTGDVIRKGIDRRFADEDTGVPETWADVYATVDYYAGNMAWRFCKVKLDQNCETLKPAQITLPSK